LKIDYNISQYFFCLYTCRIHRGVNVAIDMKNMMIELNPKEKFIINYLRFDPGKTTSEIVNALSLKRANSYNILSKLHKQGFLVCRKTQTTNGERGRNPERWYINSTYAYVIGVEFWNWWIAVGLLDFSGNIVIYKNTRCPIGSLTGNQDGLASKITDFIHDVIVESGLDREKILGIGFVAPGVVDLTTKEGIFYSHQKGLYRSALPRTVENFFGLPVIFQHNQITYAMAEYRFGGGRGISNQLTILWRSEIGAAAVQKDQLFFSDPTRHLKFGHMIIDFRGSPCRCGQRGCLGNYVSESFIISEISRLAESEGSILGGYSEINLDMVSEAIGKGDKLCIRVVFEAGNKVGVGVLNLMKLLDLELINVIGYTDDLAATLSAGIRETLDEMAPPNVQKPTIKHKGYDPFVGLRGAGETFLAQFFNNSPLK